MSKKASIKKPEKRKLGWFVKEKKYIIDLLLSFSKCEKANLVLIMCIFFGLSCCHHMQAVRVLIRFAKTYLCEAGFSALTPVRAEHRQRLGTVEKDVRLKLCLIAPNIGELSAKMQAHPSH